jgi:hypothetical protein
MKKTLLEVINIQIPDDPTCILININIYLPLYLCACLFVVYLTVLLVT